MQIAKRRTRLAAHDLSARLHAATGDENRQVIVVVTIAIGDRASVEHNRCIEERSSVFFRALERAKERRTTLDLKSIDRGEMRHFLGVSAVMRDIVMPIRNADLAIGPIRTFVREHECRDARRVGLEREREHFAQEVDSLRKIVGAAFEIRHVTHFQLRCSIEIDATLKITHAFEILIEPRAIFGSNDARETLRFTHRAIEDRTSTSEPRRRIFRRFGGSPENAFKRRTRVGLFTVRQTL